MMSFFWTHTIWFLLLGLFDIILMALNFFRSTLPKFTIGFFFAVLGATFFAETGLLIAFNAYEYLPKISCYPFLDSMIANYFSQFSITATALMIIVYKLPLIWNFIFSGMFFFIEELFIKLGIFRHLWYKSWYTFIGLLLLFWVVKIWYKLLLKTPKKFIYYITWFLGASAFYSVTYGFFIYAFSLQIIDIHLTKDFFRDQAIFLIVAHRSVLILFMIFLYRLRTIWIWKLLIFTLLFLAEYLLAQLGLLTFRNYWFLIVSVFNLLVSYFWVVVQDHFMRLEIAFT